VTIQGHIVPNTGKLKRTRRQAANDPSFFPFNLVKALSTFLFSIFLSPQQIGLIGHPGLQIEI
jgi:hypothetical protein